MEEDSFISTSDDYDISNYINLRKQIAISSKMKIINSYCTKNINTIDEINRTIEYIKENFKKMAHIAVLSNFGNIRENKLDEFAKNFCAYVEIIFSDCFKNGMELFSFIDFTVGAKNIYDELKSHGRLQTLKILNNHVSAIVNQIIKYDIKHRHSKMILNGYYENISSVISLSKSGFNVNINDLKRYILQKLLSNEKDERIPKKILLMPGIVPFDEIIHNNYLDKLIPKNSSAEKEIMEMEPQAQRHFFERVIKIQNPNKQEEYLRKTISDHKKIKEILRKNQYHGREI